MIPRDDDKRDAHLLVALRNAPDRQAAPPAELSRAILAAARAAVQRDASATRERGSLRERALAWLGRPHVPWAAAFGTLALGAMLGLMWSTIAPPLPQGTPPLADAPPQARTPSSPSAPVQAAAESKVLGDTSAKASTPIAATVPSKVIAAAPSSKGKEAPSQAPPTAFGGLAADSRASPPEKAPTDLRRLDAANTASAGSAAPAVAAPAPMVLQESDAGLARQARIAAAPLLAAKRADLSPTLDALVQGAASAGVWRAAGASWPHGEAQRRWWASVQVTTQGRWQLETGRHEPPAPWLTLTIDDRTVARLWIEDGALWVREGDRVWRATVGEAQLREWQEAVARW